MTDQEILAKAIQKATDGGWKNKWGWSHVYALADRTVDGRPTIAPDNFPSEDEMECETIIFNHAFAKALWPESKDEFEPSDKWWKKSGMWYYDGGYKPDFGGEEWMFHLQNLAVAEDPIKYLGENI